MQRRIMVSIDNEAMLLATVARDASDVADRNGDRATRRAQFDREALVHLDALYSFALKLARSRDEAEDLVSDTLLRALERWEQYHLGTNIRAWLFTILYHVFVSRKRRIDAREVQQPEDTEGWALSDPEGTVKSRLFRGRRLLQRTLANYAVAMGYLTASVVRAAVTPHVTVVVGA